MIPDKTLPVYAAIAPWSEKDNTYYFSLLYSVGQAYGFELKTPWKDLSDLQKQVPVSYTHLTLPTTTIV